jgi:hypothetical protein
LDDGRNRVIGDLQWQCPYGLGDLLEGAFSGGIHHLLLRRTGGF